MTIEVSDFSLEQICLSGQCFRMNAAGADEGDGAGSGTGAYKSDSAGSRTGADEGDSVGSRTGADASTNSGWYEIIAGNRYLKIRQDGRILTAECDEQEFEHFWRDYFDLDRNYGAIKAQINPNDSYLTKAAACGWGVRILHQDLWEMIVTFLVSQQNNIKRIHHCINLLCENYGEQKTASDGTLYYAFPEPKAFAALPKDALMACNLGYRSKYVVESAKQILSGEINLEEIKRMDYRHAREELLKLYGVGGKVADCICLFALRHMQAFPVDTHIRQALDAHYKRGFPNRRYAPVKGIMQQYIFYYELHGQTKGETVNGRES